MTTHEKIKWWLESRRSRYLASSIARELGLDETEVKIACADLSDRREIMVTSKMACFSIMDSAQNEQKTI